VTGGILQIGLFLLLAGSPRHPVASLVKGIHIERETVIPLDDAIWRIPDLRPQQERYPPPASWQGPLSSAGRSCFSPLCRAALGCRTRHCSSMVAYL